MLNPELIRNLADTLHRVVCRDASSLDDARNWVSQLRSFHDELILNRAQSQTCHVSNAKYNVTVVLEGFLMGGLLSNSAHLRDVLVSAARLLLPPSLATPLCNRLTDRTFRLPCASTMSRNRLTVDVAYMLTVRELIAELLQGAASAFVMADSSPQGGRDYEIMVFDIVSACVCADMFEYQSALFGARGLPADRRELALPTEPAMLSAFSNKVFRHSAPPVAIGSGASTLGHKFHALAHALHLLTGSQSLIGALSRSVLSVTTDLGVESALHRVLPIPCVAVLPWLQQEGSPELDLVCDEWGELPNGLALVTEEECFVGTGADLHSSDIDLSGSLGVPGMCHILHNACKDLEGTLALYKEHVDGMKRVCDLLRNKSYRDRLFESCFACQAGLALRRRLANFSGQVHRERWGTVLDCALQLEQIRDILRWGWDVDKFLGHSRQLRQEDDGNTCKIDVVDACIASAEFWGYNTMLCSLARVVMSLLDWAESCPCHHGLEPPSQGLATAWAKCPWRSRRAPELAAGDFFAEVGNLCDTVTGELLFTLPRDLDEACRCSITLDWERARSHLLFVCSMKLNFWDSPPWYFCALAHPCEKKARQCWERIRGSWELNPRSPVWDHPVCRRFFQEPVASQGHLWFTGVPLLSPQCQEFRKLVAPLALVFTAERAVEGVHARVHKIVTKAPCCTLPYISTQLRCKDIANLCQQDPTLLERMSRFVLAASSPLRSVRALGFAAHPAAALAKHYRDPVLTDLIYRGDSLSQHSPPPPIKVKPLQDVVPARQPLADYVSCPVDLQSSFAIAHLGDLLANSPGTVFSLPAKEGTIRALYVALAPGDQRATLALCSDASLESQTCFLEASPQQRQIGNDVVFLKCLVRSPHLAKRVSSSSRELSASDFGITLHELVPTTLAADKTHLLNTTPRNTHTEHPLDLPAVLSLASFSLQELCSVDVWETSQTLTYMMPDIQPPAGMDNAMFEKVLTDVLPALCSGDYSVLSDQEHPDSAARAAVIAHLEAEYVCTESPHRLTELGQCKLVLCQTICNPKNALSRRDVLPSAMSRWELMSFLFSEGWSLQSKPPQRGGRKKSLPPYQFPDGEKFFYCSTTSASQQLGRLYMLALATAADHRKPVPHQQPQRVYAELLGLAAPTSARPRHKLSLVREDACFSEGLPSRVSQQAVRQVLPDLWGEEGPREEDQEQDKEGEEEEEEEEEGEDDKDQGLEEGDEDSSEDSSSSSSSSSSSADSSSDDSDGPGEVSEHPDSKHARNMQASVKLGVFRLTPYANGWQATCLNPHHNLTSAKCTKSRAHTRPGGSAASLKMLTAWAVWGCRLRSKEAHRDVWSRVETAFLNKTLPSVDELAVLRKACEQAGFESQEPLPPPEVASASSSVGASGSGASGHRPDPAQKRQRRK